MIQMTGASAENGGASLKYRSTNGCVLACTERWLPHYIIHQPFMSWYTCIVVCVLHYVCVCVCSDSNTL